MQQFQDYDKAFMKTKLKGHTWGVSFLIFVLTFELILFYPHAAGWLRIGERGTNYNLYSGSEVQLTDVEHP